MPISIRLLSMNCLQVERRLRQLLFPEERRDEIVARVKMPVLMKNVRLIGFVP